MAMSETREGPGWWMAPDGGWNPPEMWPEATPPLPGWVRLGNGRWSAPDKAVDVDLDVDLDVDASGVPEVQMGEASPAGPEVLDLRDGASLNPTHVPQHLATHAEPKVQVDGQEPEHRLSLGFGPQAQTHEMLRQHERQGLTRRRLFLIAVAVIACTIAGLVLAAVLL